MTPLKQAGPGFGFAATEDGVLGLRLFDETAANEDANNDPVMETSSLTSPPRQFRHSNSLSTVQTLFVDHDDDDDDGDSKGKPPRTVRKQNTSHPSSWSTAAAAAEEGIMSDTSEGANSILRPLDLNSSPNRRKRPGDSFPAGREDLMEESSEEEEDDDGDDTMFVSPHASPPSPRPSPTFRTLDGRVVTSKNPFSPYTPSINTSMEDEDDEDPIDVQSAPTFPVTLEPKSSEEEDGDDEAPSEITTSHSDTHHLLGAARPPKIHLQQRESRNGFPGGRFSFTGSPIAEMEFEDDEESSNHGSIPHHHHHKMGSKVRRVDSTSTASSRVSTQQHKKLSTYQNVNNKKQPSLQVDSSSSLSTNTLTEDISPTDVASFPTMTPPTPLKPARPRHFSYTPVKANRPKTPLVERRTLARRTSDESEEEEDACTHHHHVVVKSRFKNDFDIIGELGNGSFGTVYKCLSRLDGCMYAIKEAKRKFKGQNDRGRMLKEVYALAALSDQADPAAFHIVRYHQAWLEENRLYIQTELCSCTLQAEMRRGSPPTEKRRYKLLREILLALELLHRNNMVHLDIKPDNIFVKNDQFKVGDFGLVTKITNGGDVEEGDSRYMSMELLSGDHSDLTKSDIFSLGATMYEICLGRPLPMDGQEWQDIRAGILHELKDTPLEMEVIIKQMMHPDPKERPAASELLRRRPLLSEEQKQLMAEKSKVLQANMALALQTQQMRYLSPPPPRGNLIRANTWTGGTFRASMQK